MSTELVRANKITAYWEGDGVAIGAFYKTHTRIETVKSNEQRVLDAGFKMPEGTEEAPTTAQDKLSAFKTFLQVNAAVFGIAYDPVDRRSDEFKYPNKYDENTFKEYSQKMVESQIGETLDKVQKNVIENMIKAGNLPAKSEIGFGVTPSKSEVTELYSNGSIKYANAEFVVVFALNDKTASTTCTAQMVSGQLKKPRELANEVTLTQTGLKTYLTEAGLLPVVVKETAKDKEDAETSTPKDAEKADTTDTAE